MNPSRNADPKKEKEAKEELKKKKKELKLIGK
jgi:hypothetical protein